MKMRPVASIDIKAKGEAVLKPGGYHVMLIDPTTTLKEGDKVAVTLVFSDGSRKSVDAVVKKPEAAAAAPSDHAHHDHAY